MEKAATIEEGVVRWEPAPGDDWNPVERVILERRSVRKYLDKQVPEHLVRRILEAGRFAPTHGNCQPWKFVVIRDRDIIDRMERYTQRVCKMLSFLLDWRAHPRGGKLRWLFAQVMIRLLPNLLYPIPFFAITLIAQGRLGLFHGAPTVILILTDKRGISNPDIDLGICGQNMVLAAHSYGLGTCWVGFVKVLGRNPFWKRRLGIRYPYVLYEGISLGYPWGEPDGIVARELHEIDWYEGGKKKVLY